MQKVGNGVVLDVSGPTSLYPMLIFVTVLSEKTLNGIDVKLPIHAEKFAANPLVMELVAPTVALSYVIQDLVQLVRLRLNENALAANRLR